MSYVKNMERTTKIRNKSPYNKAKIKKAPKKTDGDYDRNYECLIKEEMHRLSNLSLKVPKCYEAEIYQMSVSMEAILQEIKRNREFDKL